ncbi:hypothetical protein SELSPUOL_00750 [Selenomonas sputigena ATCC 35185]|uniref:Uncharacterized protein n=1 Tax=Selenomonas sputigena (strain ATCC 35185 / DSM 20758 / CCUG 44933 / VPI D19B-28) TaxID=546271 RepID=C9LTG7_SELS3|nr:hypothetical protein SELSPUOL_00750 [Selenomonas sputigena ATCC 35185]
MKKGLTAQRVRCTIYFAGLQKDDCDREWRFLLRKQMSFC